MNHPRIQQLSSLVANQIAAGEVIERPASVVKELLENALDAGANQINIDIGFGGLNQIKISDNGHGIFVDDLPLAIAPHATSKIKELDDLFAITSMGFRGEALASIASVSRLTLQSKPFAQEHAMMLNVENGIMKLLPCARSQGTTVDVRDLFFNTPVRKSFLKSERIEFQAIEAVIRRFALSAAHVALNLKHNDKKILSLPAVSCEQTRLMRIKKILGKAFIEQAAFLDIERAGMRLYGWISLPSYQRSQNDKQWFYVNGRMVKDKLLQHALKQAYEAFVYPGRHPACILYLNVATQDIDVNVHPTKHEVRFRDQRSVHDLITSQIISTLTSKTFNASVENSVLAVHEKAPKPYFPKVLDYDAQATINFSANQWHNINSEFSLIYLNRNHYLIDVPKLLKQRLTHEIGLQAFPWARRRVLVPIKLQIKPEADTILQQHYDFFKQLGIEYRLISNSELILDTIPVVMPLLDINTLLQNLPDTLDDIQQLMHLCIESHDFNHYSLTEEEKISLLEFIQHVGLLSNSLQSWGKILDESLCRKLMHE